MSATMIDIGEFHYLVIAKAPAAPIPEVENALRKAAAVLCRRLKVWLEDAEFEITDPLAEVVYTNQDARIHAINNGRLDAMPVQFATPAQLDIIQPNWQDMPAGVGRWITQMTPNTIRVVPSATGTLQCRLQLYPSPTAIQFPEFLLTDYADILEDGACGTILTESTNAEFSNPPVGAMLAARFMGALDERDASAVRLQTRNPHRTRGKFF